MSSSNSNAMTIDELHQYIRQQTFDCAAEEPSTSSGFFGPIGPSPISTFIGERWLQEGSLNVPTVGVMFRCVWPREKGSRYVLINMTPSVSEESLATKLCQIFDLPATGGVITKTMPEFVPGLDPLTVPNKVYSWDELFETLGSTMAGFMEVTVVPADEMAVCKNCGSRKTINAEMLGRIRKWCFGVTTTCIRCCRTGGFPGNVIETCMPDGRVLPTFYK